MTNTMSSWRPLCCLLLVASWSAGVGAGAVGGPALGTAGVVGDRGAAVVPKVPRGLAALRRGGRGGIRESAAAEATDGGEQAAESEVLASLRQLSGGSTGLAMSGAVAVKPTPAPAPYHVPGAHLRIAFQGEPGAYSGSFPVG